MVGTWLTLKEFEFPMWLYNFRFPTTLFGNWRFSTSCQIHGGHGMVRMFNLSLSSRCVPLWLEIKMSLIVCLVLSWQHHLGKLWHFQGVGPNQRKQISKGGPFKMPLGPWFWPHFLLPGLWPCKLSAASPWNCDLRFSLMPSLL